MEATVAHLHKELEFERADHDRELDELRAEYLSCMESLYACERERVRLTARIAELQSQLGAGG